MNIKLLNAERIDNNFIEVTFELDNEKFKVQWDNLSQTEFNTELDHYHPNPERVYSENNELICRVIDAINEGESDDNVDVELYLFIRDEFNPNAIDI